MKEYLLAFIVLCSNVECKDKRTYSDKASYSYETCRDFAKGWSIQMYTLTKKEYSFGCEIVNFEPKEIK